MKPYPIRFLNHASFIVRGAEATLLCDPYLRGSAFNNGWDLLWRDIEYDGLDRVTHIWFSHEHPDHFSPPFLQSLGAERRKSITILFQETKDKRVVKFCRNLGFNVIELPHGKPVRIDTELEILCGFVPLYDSWAFINVKGLRILNLNDCILTRDDQLASIASLVPQCDILFTQFSYAGWNGSPEDSRPRQEEAAGYFRRIILQCEKFRPKFVVPFASFIFFSHIENSWMNDSVNDIAATVEHIRARCQALPIVLVPNEQWDGRSPNDTHANVRAWMERYSAGAAKPLHASPAVSADQLQVAAAAFRKRMFTRNSRVLIQSLARIGVLPTILFNIWDLNTTMSFSWLTGLKNIPSPEAKAPDVSLGAESLAFLFNQDFGADTLNVNARFQATAAGKRKLIRAFSVPSLNNTGRFVNGSIFRLLLEPAFIKEGLQAIGVLRRG